MKRYLFVMILAIMTIRPTWLVGQQIRSEVPMTFEGGVLKSRRVVVSFNQNVIPIPRGINVVDIQRYPIQNQSVRGLIQSLSQLYGTPTIRKTMPHLVWGDTLVRNKWTGQLRRVPDMSQEFALDFPVPVPLHNEQTIIIHSIGHRREVYKQR